MMQARLLNHKEETVMTQNATTQKSTAKSVVIVILLVLLAAACTLGFLAMNRAMQAEEQNAALEREKASR